ncbi:cytochrome c3 family protein [Geomonas edaphica]|uniref:hypothetical protein n=1 Tax=Geomonas edaphica TaxID=2570226 RepID=UPI0010A7B8D4|nr:hypothetical protein [Geomonas edaphica]
MLRKVGLASALLLAIPALASAWTVTAKIGSGAGIVTDGTTQIAKPGTSIAYYKQDNLTGATTQTFTVDPADGYSVASVIVNGVDVTGTVLPNANGTYTVAKGTPVINNQSLVVYFKQNLGTIDITQVTGGKITLQRLDALTNKPIGSMTMSDMPNVKPGTKVRVTAMPNSDYVISNLNGLTATSQPTALPTLYPGDSFSQDVTATAGTLTVPVSFTQVAVVKPNLSASSTYLNPGDTIIVTASAVSNMSPVTYAVSTDASDAVIAPAKDSKGVVIPNQFTVKFPTVGKYDLTVTATANNTAFTATKKDLVTVENNNACTTCHATRNASLFASWNTSTHGPGTSAAPSCVSCHTATDPHVVKAACVDCHNTADAITADWSTGAHGLASGHNTGTCQRCHATEGAIAGFAVGFTGGYADVLNNTNAKAAWTTVSTGLTSNPGISCKVCHDPHNTGGLRAVNTYDTTNKKAIVWDPNGNGKVDQYDVCTGCHTLTNNSGALVGNYHDGSSASVERTISDSHFDNPDTTVVEGYNLRKNGATPCADCHNLHKADVTVQEEWAESGHAGKILAAKEAALVTNAALYYGAPAGTDVTTVLNPGSTRTYLEDYKRTTTAAANGTLSANALLKTIGPDPLEAFVHYNWSKTDDTVVGDRTGRAACQKCHTATGAANYMNNPTTYAAANNDYSHLAGWSKTAGSKQTELLYCWGCHSDSATGALRNPGSVVADYKFQGTAAVYPNVGPSNTCLTCHVGQASGNSVTDLTAAGNTFTNVSFVNSHYMAAGSLMYAKGGYTNFVPATTAADTMSYGQSLTSDADQTVTTAGVATAGKLTSTHRKLGTSAINGDTHNTAKFVPGFLDTDGPCVTCHYAKGDVAKGDNGVADHTLEMGAKTLNGVCTNCHAAEAADAAGLNTFIEEQSEPFQETLTLALNLLSTKYNITYDQAAYPYFYDQSASAGAVKNWTRSNFLTTGLSAADAEKLMGACFNINLLKRDPAAYAHARTYARRLLFDTIDFLDDGIMNQSAAATALASGLKDAKGNLVYVKGATSNDPLTTEGYKYIAGYNRTSFAWNAWVRP